MKTFVAALLSTALLATPAASAEYLFPRANAESDQMQGALISDFGRSSEGAPVIIWVFPKTRPLVAIMCKVDEATLELYKLETPEDRSAPRFAYVIDAGNLPENCQTGTATPSGSRVTKSA